MHWKAFFAILTYCNMGRQEGGAAVRALFTKYKELILYVFFGGLTTLVNWGGYWVLADLFHVPYLWATAIAQILSILFAYVTNRRWVFDSQASSPGEIVREAFSFAVCRLLSGLMDVAIMYVCVDLLHWNDLLIKIISNVLVVIANYVASKLFVFRSR